MSYEHVVSPCGNSIRPTRKACAQELMRARSIILLIRDVGKGVKFYGEGGLGLALKHSSDTMAEFETGGTPLVLKTAAGSEAACSVG